MNRLATSDGLELECRWDVPGGDPAHIAVLCHPHPRHGGTMNAPLMTTVTESLLDAGAAVLRFNFRGVGSSQGHWGEGVGEIDDVAAAVAGAAQEFPGIPLGLAGWSFGAVTSLRWQARDASTLPWAGIAPPVRLATGGDLPDPGSLAPARRLFVIGDRDQFTATADLERYAAAAGGEFRLVPGSDHFFSIRGRRIGDLVAGHLSGRPTDEGMQPNPG